MGHQVFTHVGTKTKICVLRVNTFTGLLINIWEQNDSLKCSCQNYDWNVCIIASGFHELYFLRNLLCYKLSRN